MSRKPHTGRTKACSSNGELVGLNRRQYTNFHHRSRTTLNPQAANYVTQTIYWPHGGVLQQGYGNNLFRKWVYINGELEPTGYWDTIGADPSPSLYLRLEFPHWGTATNTGTPQGTTIYAGSSRDWTSLPNVTQTFGFDSLNRLAFASEDSDWSQSYNYDQYGNMWMPSSTLPAPALGPVAPTTNVYSASNNRNVYSSYDASGNLAAFGAIGLSYDAENRQTGAGVNSYLYDGAGRRVSKTTGSGQTAFVYDAFGQLAAEYAGGTVWTKDYIRHGGQIVAIENASGSPCTTCYLSLDLLGGVRMVTDQYANVIARHDYAPFGQEIQSGVGPRTSLWGASDNVNQKFTGQERDGETDLDFLQARYLSSGLGRFASPDAPLIGSDPKDPQSWNLYSYVRNRPTSTTDPNGHHIVDCSIDACGSPFGPAAGAGAATGGGVGGVILDGVEQTVFNSSGLGDNGVAQCPNNYCSGFAPVGNGNIAYVQYTAAADGNGTYAALSTPTPDMSLPANQAYAAYMLACQHTTDPCAGNDPVTTRYQGLAGNYALIGTALNGATVSGMIPDPITAVHNGPSWYDWSPVSTGHVATTSSGLVETHFDAFSPIFLNPLHFLFDYLPSLFINPKPGVMGPTYICTPGMGCHP